MTAECAAWKAEAERLSREAQMWHRETNAEKARADRLAALVESAPHHFNCTLMECRRSHGHRTKPPCPCDCWKSRAASALKEE